jgi:hypothetical protein
VKFYFGSDNSRPVTKADDLSRYLPPDKRHHYKDGFSMAEAAKRWIAANGKLPSEIAALVGSDDLETAHFEYQTKVWGRGTSVTDVMAFVPNGVVAIEAKVKESFDDIVSVWIDRDGKRSKNSPPHRRRVIAQYAGALGVEHERLFTVRYQLLHRTLSAALAAKARGAVNAWMIVHSFASAEAEECRNNRSDFDQFVNLVGEQPTIDGQRVKLAWIDGVRS